MTTSCKLQIRLVGWLSFNSALDTMHRSDCTFTGSINTQKVYNNEKSKLQMKQRHYCFWMLNLNVSTCNSHNYCNAFKKSHRETEQIQCKSTEAYNNGRDTTAAPAAVLHIISIIDNRTTAALPEQFPHFHWLFKLFGLLVSSADHLQPDPVLLTCYSSSSSVEA